ncbi:MAG: HNH endonuclease signature motif containing protein [Verrucomicrobiota bacterium]
MDAKRREQVRQRAGNRCEYCRLRQEHDSYHPFHIEHIIARQHGGANDSENLAWSCHQCNLHKGTNLSGLDPDTNEMVRLFHPRRDRWQEHFVLNASVIGGLTAIGRTTSWLLQMNSEERVELRKILMELGELD